MDKIFLSSEDVEFVLGWRDKNKEYVRRNNAPVKAIKMIFPETKYEITAVKRDNLTRFCVNLNGTSKGNFAFEYMVGGYQRLESDNSSLSADEKQTVLTVYSSVMALMVFGNILCNSIEKKLKKNTVLSMCQNKPKSVTYVLHKSNRDGFVLPKGHHASPKGMFTVRGHFRHYTDGKVVWISEFVKGNGKKKNTNYLLSSNLLEVL